MSFQQDLFDDMVNDIITLTARPDLADETALALRTATNNAHFSDGYPRDLVTQSVQLPNASYQTTLNIPTLFPKFRGLSQLKGLDVNYSVLADGETSRIEVVELNDIYDDYNVIKNNIAYVAGESINIRSLTNTYGFLVEWFKAPETKRDNYNSWIAQLYPDVILYWAASLVLDTNGNEEKATKFMKQVQQIHLPYLKNNFLLGVIR